jgi:hypothetical protein
VSRRPTLLALPLLAVAPPARAAAQALEPPHPAPVVVPAPAPRNPPKLAPRPTTGAITAQDLMTRLYGFADDSMMGREAGTLGNERATAYLAAEARRLGLRPAGDSGSYFQVLPFKTRRVDSTSTIRAGAATLRFGADWVMSTGRQTERADVPVVFAGDLADTVRTLAPQDAAGKLIVFRMQPVPEAEGMLIRRLPLYREAAAVALVGVEQYMGYFRAPRVFLDRGDTSAEPPLLLSSTTAIAALFPGGTLDGLAPGAAGSAPATLAIRVTDAPVSHPARNVVALLPGSDPALRGQYVALGAHNDHVGYATPAVDHDSLRIFDHLVRPGGAEDMGRSASAEQQAEVNRQLAAWRAAHPGTTRLDSIANGADDDGSGSVGVLEIAERLATARARPRRSVLFVWHTGEEKGLLGSAWYTDHPTVPRDSIVAQLNIDMIGRGDAWDVTGTDGAGAPLHGNPDYLQLVGSRRLSTELGDLVERVNLDGRHALKFDYALDADGHPLSIYCRSDHYEYARFGIPVVFFTTGGHSDYHQVTDEPRYIDYPHMARVASLVADVATRVAKLDHRVVVDHPKPDPTATCRQ